MYYADESGILHKSVYSSDGKKLGFVKQVFLDNIIIQSEFTWLRKYLMARTAGRFNTIKIVPLVTFQGIIERCKQIEEGTFFPPDAAG